MHQPPRKRWQDNYFICKPAWWCVAEHAVLANTLSLCTEGLTMKSSFKQCCCVMLLATTCDAVSFLGEVTGRWAPPSDLLGSAADYLLDAKMQVWRKGLRQEPESLQGDPKELKSNSRGPQSYSRRIRNKPQKLHEEPKRNQPETNIFQNATRTRDQMERNLRKTPREPARGRGGTPQEL